MALMSQSRWWRVLSLPVYDGADGIESSFKVISVEPDTFSNANMSCMIRIKCVRPMAQLHGSRTTIGVGMQHNFHLP